MDHHQDRSDLGYLLRGDNKQKQVYAAIHTCRAMELLSAFDPTLTGTYPIGIHLPDSDIDIICHYAREELFENVLVNAFGFREGFELTRKTIRGEACIISRFNHNGFLFEIFGQDRPVVEQYAFRHMLMEHKILSEKDPAFRYELIRLKEKGLSTEEAFCTLLGIDGDPYVELLRLET
ncbi:MAG: DUF4269 domain-containing protein [Bacteroidales bacterium]|jgi:hypothetical protein|nr:DUF4269 domain-containing protein [Bacteroidales bacterium]